MAANRQCLSTGKLSANRADTLAAIGASFWVGREQTLSATNPKETHRQRGLHPLFLNRRLVLQMMTGAGSPEATNNLSAIFVHDTRDMNEKSVHQTQTEEALRNSESHYRLLFENNPTPVYVYDETTLGFLAVNKAAVLHYG